KLAFLSVEVFVGQIADRERDGTHFLAGLIAFGAWVAAELDLGEVIFSNLACLLGCELGSVKAYAPLFCADAILHNPTPVDSGPGAPQPVAEAGKVVVAKNLVGFTLAEGELADIVGGQFHGFYPPKNVSPCFPSGFHDIISHVAIVKLSREIKTGY